MFDIIVAVDDQSKVNSKTGVCAALGWEMMTEI